MSKGITPIIAIIVLLLITVALAGGAWTFMQGYWEAMTGKTIKMVFGSGINNRVMISNMGTKTILADELMVLVAGKPAPIIDPQDIGPGKTRQITFLPSDTGRVSVNVIGPHNTISYNVDIDKVSANGLVSYWNFETEGQAEDITGDNDATLGDGTCSPGTGTCPSWTSDGKSGGAYEFDGTDDYIEIDGSSQSLVDLTDDSNSFTFELWLKPYDFTSDGYALSRVGYHIGLFYLSTSGNFRGNIYYFDNTELYIADNDLTPDTWHHLAMTVDETNNEFKIYLDGSQVGGTATIEYELREYGTANYYIGAATIGDRIVYGVIDEARLWSRVLSSEEISNIYEAGTS